MRLLHFSLLSLLFTASAEARFDVHEWGTFTSVVSANGKPQPGMVQEDEELPAFVHHFGENRLPPPRPRPTPRNPDCPRFSKIPCEYLNGQVITQKMETPVVYFYSDVSRPVSFDVSFPTGIISQSYPAPSFSAPAPIPGVSLRNGRARYDLQILKYSHRDVPYVEPGNIYGHARNVQSDLVSAGGELEKFLFYRGLGEFNPELRYSSENGGIRLLQNTAKNIPAVFLVYTSADGLGNIRSFGSVSAKRIINLDAEELATFKAEATPSFEAKARDLLSAALTKAGLYGEEANAMLDTWTHGYFFQTPGLRVLYVLHGEEVESILPARVSPEPDTFVRAFVGRLELLLDTEEEALLAKFRAQRRNFSVLELGRRALPILNRLEEITRERGLHNAGVAADFLYLKSLL